ncbi:MAG: preprotein translocase subunit SecG [Thiolinea sp.]
MLYNILLIVQILVSVAMIVLILMQHGKGADAGAAFGSGASGTVFGSRGSANFLSRTTGILATVFFINCIALAWLVSDRTAPVSTVTDILQTEQSAPAVPQNSEVPAVPGQSEGSEVPAAPAQQPAEVPAAPAAEVPAAPVTEQATEVPAAPAAAEVPAAPAAPEVPAAAEQAAPQKSE